MRVRIEQLEASLQRQLAAVYLVTGDEPLQVIEATDAIRRAACERGAAERQVYTVGKDFEWAQLQQQGASLSLFSTRRLFELRLGTSKPGRDGGVAISGWLKNHADDDTLLISAARLDKQGQRASWFKAVDTTGVVVQVWPVAPAQLPQWVSQRVRRHGKSIDQPACELIAERVEGNLLAAKQEIDKLALLVDGTHISLQDAAASVVDSARFEVFSMLEACLRGDAGRTVRMLHGLRNEAAEPIALLGAVLWELRRVCSIARAIEAGQDTDQAFAAFRVWKDRRNAIHSVLVRHRARGLRGLLKQAALIDRASKGLSTSDPWHLLERFLLRIAGSGVQSGVF